MSAPDTPDRSWLETDATPLLSSSRMPDAHLVQRMRADNAELPDNSAEKFTSADVDLVQDAVEKMREDWEGIARGEATIAALLILADKLDRLVRPE